MPIPFSIVCDLLEDCHKLCIVRKSHSSVVAQWFSRYRALIDAHDSNLVALLSTILPETRPDRVYAIQPPTLEKIVSRGLGLGHSRIAELRRYRKSGSGVDLADCVCSILSVTPNHVPNDSQVTVEDVDELLHGMASRIKWSSPAIRASQPSTGLRGRADLEAMYRRLNPSDAKWFTRLVLKTYEPLIFESQFILKLCHPLLPAILKIREDFSAAISLLQSYRTRGLPSNDENSLSRCNLLAKVKPRLGVKVGRQNWFKARSIKHCFDLGSGRMSVEQKVDGEYCQVHIDLSKASRRIQVFSKSGKDSTEDRCDIHGTIENALRLGRSDCGFSKACILECELVVYSDAEQRILPFHKIRGHVRRRGRLINVDLDSPPTQYEHLMLVFYDVLLVDDRSLLDTQHSERYKILESLIHCETGWAELVRRHIIDFNHRHAAASLRKMFAETIVSKGEGLVLKPNRPYFNFSDSIQPQNGCCIKLKKEYIGNFGEVGDFAAVGAGYDPMKAKSYKIPNLKWTHFYVGCLDNKEEVQRWSATPRFTVVSMVEINQTMLKTLITFGNPMPVPIQENRATELTMSRGVNKQPQLTVVFTNPVVFDLRCFSFDKEGNNGFWSPRFPQVSKIHFDRDFTDCVSFEELQAMAKEAMNVEPPDDSQENLDWIARLQAADPRGIAVDAVSEATESQATRTSISSEEYGPVHSSQRITDQTHGKGAISPSSTQDSSTRYRGCEDRSLFGSQLCPMTPPTSSPYPENAEEKAGSCCGSKRSPSSAVATRPLKKRKSLKSDTSSIPAPFKDKTSAPRQPLGVIDPNSSQVSVSSTKHESVIRKLSPIVEAAPFCDEPFEIAAITASQPFSLTSEPLTGNDPSEVIVISDDEDDTQQRKSDKNSQATRRPQGGVRSSASFNVTIRIEPQPACTYASSMCQFATKTVLVAPHLFIRPEQETSDLLAAHGLKSRMINARTWLDNIRKAARSVQLGLQEGEIVMLVDCLEHDEEMNSILEEMEDTRSMLYPDNRNWITIYDWRVLKHISVLEDGTIMRKYYDGFSNPWKRWHCGLV